MNGPNYNRVRVWISFLEARCLDIQEQMDLEESGEIEEEEDDFDYYGSNSIPPIKPKYKSVTLQVNLDGISSFTIISKVFVWTYPWMRCRLSVFRGQGDIISYIKRGFFEVLEYELNDIPGMSSIQKFLSNTSLSLRVAFEEYIRRSLKLDIRLSQIWTLLDSWPDTTMSSELKEDILKSLEGHVLLLSQNYPNMFKYGVLLFQNKFLSLVEKESNEKDSEVTSMSNEEVISTLEDIFSKNYWALGFNDILYQRTSCSGLEVKLRALKLTPFYKKLDIFHQNALEFYDKFKSRCYREGHTYLNRRDVESLIQSCRDLDEICKFLARNKIITASGEIYQLTRFEKAESNTSSKLKLLMLKSPFIIDLNEHTFEGLSPDKEQQKAAKMIADNPITVISGRGGTGKTEIVTSVLSNLNQSIKQSEDESSLECKETPEIVLYVAPTGKAASVIRHRIKKNAYTIHQIIASHKKFTKDRSNPWKFANIEVLVVDECSMVGICLFSRLLSILDEDSHIRKIVLLGDVLQLPSIDPGNLMCDLFESLSPLGYSIELLTNHRSEGTLIFDNARRISQRKMPIFDDERGFILIEPTCENQNLNRRCLTLKNQFNNIFKKEKVEEQRMNTYLKLLVEDSKKHNVDSQKTSQIISFTRKECEILNQLCCKIYNDHFIYNYYNNRKIKTFLDSDKIMCTKNKDVTLLTIKNDVIVKKKEERLMNGSVFVIDSMKTYCSNTKNDEDEELVNGMKDSILAYELNDLLGESIYVEKKSFDKLCRPSHAWALTIHKFQGSETNTIIYGVSNSRNENWKHVYTAVTRGKKKVIIVGSRCHLEAAVFREFKPRQTRLKSLVEDLFASLSEEQSSMTFSSDEELEELAFSNISALAESVSSSLVHEKTKESDLNSSLWENNASFDVMLSQIEEKDCWSVFPRQEFTPPSSPSKRPKTTNITPSLNAKLKLL